MGLFGRDDQSDGIKPSPAEPQSRTGAASASGSTITLIARNTRVEGEISGPGEVRIEGAFKGKLDCSSLVTISDGGSVEAELKAEVISIAGRVRGNAIAGKKIELTPSADMQGDITAPRILIREGATFEGQVFMSGKPKKKTDPAPDKTKPAKPSEPEPTS